MDKETSKEIVEATEEVVVEIVKAPFKIARKLFGWVTGDDY